MFRCRERENGISQYCNLTDIATVYNATVSGAKVVEDDLYSFPWYWNVIITMAFGLVFRIVAYLALRFLHKKKQ